MSPRLMILKNDNRIVRQMDSTIFHESPKTVSHTRNKRASQATLRPEPEKNIAPQLLSFSKQQCAVAESSCLICGERQVLCGAVTKEKLNAGYEGDAADGGANLHFAGPTNLFACQVSAADGNASKKAATLSDRRAF